MKYIRKLRLILLALLVGSVPVTMVDVAHADPIGSATLYTVPKAGENIKEGPDGSIWMTRSSLAGGGVMKMSKTGTTTVYSNTTINGVYHNFTAGADNGMWFTKGAKISTVSSQGITTSYNAPSGSLPSANGIANGPDGNIWYTIGDGTPANSKIGRISTTGSYLSPYAVGGLPVSLVSDPDNDKVWYVTRPSGGGKRGLIK